MYLTRAINTLIAMFVWPRVEIVLIDIESRRIDFTVGIYSGQLYYDLDGAGDAAFVDLKASSGVDFSGYWLARYRGWSRDDDGNLTPRVA